MKRKRCGRYLVTAVLALLLTGQILYTNAAAYSFREQIFSPGEWVPLEGDFFYSSQEHTEGYSLRVSSAEVMSYEAFMDRFHKPYDYLGESSRYDVVVLKVDFKNEGNTQGGVYIREFNLKNETRSQYFSTSSDYMAIANPGFDPDTEGIRVQPGTESSLYFVYDTLVRADRVTYLEQQKTADSIALLLNVSLYPVNKMIQIQASMNGISENFEKN